MQLRKGIVATPAKQVPEPVQLLKRMLEIVHGTEFHVFEIYHRISSLPGAYDNNPKTKFYLFVGNPKTLLVRWCDWKRVAGVNAIIGAMKLASVLKVDGVVAREDISEPARDLASKHGVLAVSRGEVISFLRVHGEDV